MKYVIIGGVAGGATAAARLRRIDEQAEIILLEKGKYISYANCGLPYYIGGVIAEREKLLVQTPASFGKRFRIDVRVENEVIAIDSEKKTLTIRKADGKEYEETYDKLLLSPGANPVKPPLEGIDSEGIFTLRNVEDTDRIKAYITDKQVKRTVVVGAGFIGLEMAENLHHAGVAVSVVEMGNQVMAPIDFSMAAPIHRHLIEKGVSLYLEEGVTRFRRTEEGITVFLKSGKTIPADIVLLSIGVRPATALAQQAGLELGETGGIRVDEHLETSVKDIYAVGDAIEYPHPLTGKPWLNYLANPANRQGRIVADNMALGNTTSYEGAIGTSIAKVFDMTVASTGLAAKRLKQWGMEYQSSVTHSASHAGYYPDALPLTLKLTFHPKTGKLYGAQCVGYEGVDKRIDQIAGLIKHGGTVYDLMETEHTYAPPFSSAKDPIAIAGYVASNIISGAMPVISWRELAEKKDEVMLIDTRTPEEFSFGTIPGAVNIPLDEMRDRLSEIPADKPVVLFCAVGLRGYLAQRILIGRGYRNTANLIGGYKTYSAAVAPIPAPTASSPAQPAASAAGLYTGACPRHPVSRHPFRYIRGRKPHHQFSPGPDSRGIGLSVIRTERTPESKRNLHPDLGFRGKRHRHRQRGAHRPLDGSRPDADSIARTQIRHYSHRHEYRPTVGRHPCHRRRGRHRGRYLRRNRRPVHSRQTGYPEPHRPGPGTRFGRPRTRYGQGYGAGRDRRSDKRPGHRRHGHHDRHSRTRHRVAAEPLRPAPPNVPTQHADTQERPPFPGGLSDSVAQRKNQ